MRPTRCSARPPPTRHWRSYGDDKLPTPAEALGEPFSAFPLMVHEDQVRSVRQGADDQRDAYPAACHVDPRRYRRKRHDSCGGRAGKVELITGIEGASSRPVRKIVLRE
jgi:hypothetical protein